MATANETRKEAPPDEDSGPLYFSPEEQLRRLCDHARDGVEAMRLLLARLRRRVPRADAWELTDGLADEQRRYYDAMGAIMDLAAGHLPLGQHKALREHRDAFELGVRYFRSEAEHVQRIVREQAGVEPPPGRRFADPIVLDISPTDLTNTRSQGERLIAMTLLLITSAPAHDGFVPNKFQVLILKALDRAALTKQQLCEKLKVDSGRLYRKGLKELIALGKVKNRTGLGYYRPDRPPPYP